MKATTRFDRVVLTLQPGLFPPTKAKKAPGETVEALQDPTMETPDPSTMAAPEKPEP